jgi:hypothetical protein
VSNRQQEVDTNEKHRQALELRKAGVAYAVIAERLGYKTESGAWRAVMSALKKTLREPADELRKLEAERLDGLWLAIISMAKAGNLGAIDRALKIQDRRAKLLGLDLAHEISFNIDWNSVTDEQLGRIVAGEPVVKVLLGK